MGLLDYLRQLLQPQQPYQQQAMPQYDPFEQQGLGQMAPMLGQPPQTLDPFQQQQIQQMMLQEQQLLDPQQQQKLGQAAMMGQQGPMPQAPPVLDPFQQRDLMQASLAGGPGQKTGGAGGAPPLQSQTPQQQSFLQPLDPVTASPMPQQQRPPDMAMAGMGPPQLSMDAPGSSQATPSSGTINSQPSLDPRIAEMTAALERMYPDPANSREYKVMEEQLRMGDQNLAGMRGVDAVGNAYGPGERTDPAKQATPEAIFQSMQDSYRGGRRPSQNIIAEIESDPKLSAAMWDAIKAKQDAAELAAEQAWQEQLAAADAKGKQLKFDMFDTGVTQGDFRKRWDGSARMYQEPRSPKRQQELDANAKTSKANRQSDLGLREDRRIANADARTRGVPLPTGDAVARMNRLARGAGTAEDLALSNVGAEEMQQWKESQPEWQNAQQVAMLMNNPGIGDMTPDRLAGLRGAGVGAGVPDIPQPTPIDSGSGPTPWHQSPFFRRNFNSASTLSDSIAGWLGPEEQANAAIAQQTGVGTPQLSRLLTEANSGNAMAQQILRELKPQEFAILRSMMAAGDAQAIAYFNQLQ